MQEWSEDEAAQDVTEGRGRTRKVMTCGSEDALAAMAGRMQMHCTQCGGAREEEKCGVAVSDCRRKRKVKQPRRTRLYSRRASKWVQVTGEGFRSGLWAPEGGLRFARRWAEEEELFDIIFRSVFGHRYHMMAARDQRRDIRYLLNDIDRSEN